MWAIRGAANPIRSRAHCIVACRSCAALLEVLNRLPDAENGCFGDELRHENSGSALRRSSSCGASFGMKFYSGCRSFSSRSGEESSDKEDEIEDGFSDLDMPAEAASEVEDEELDPESGPSDVDIAEQELRLSGYEASEIIGNSSGSKIPSLLFEVIMKAPWTSISDDLDKWVEEHNALGRNEISDAILQLRKRRLYSKALKFLEWLEENKLLDFTERDYTSRLDLIAKVQGLKRAEQYIREIPNTLRSEVIYRTLLANCVIMGNARMAEQVFNKMKDLGFGMTAFSCNQMILLYKRADRKKIAEILLLMEKDNIAPTLFTYKLLIDTKGLVSDIPGMVQIVEKMKSEGMEPDFHIQTIIAKHYIYGGLNEKAEAMLKEIEGDDVKSRRYTCKALLPLYAALGKPDDVERIWKVCEDRPHHDEWLAAIIAWGKLGRVEDAEKIFENMLSFLKKPSIKCYNALLKVYANHKLLSKGKELAKRMEDDGCKIDPLTWDALVKLYIKAGDVDTADSILLEADSSPRKAGQQNQGKPIYSSYMAVLDEYAKRGDVHNAEKVFRALRRTGHKRMRQYHALLKAYVNAKKPAYGFQDRMKADNMFPTKALAAHLASADAFRKTQISWLLD